MAVYTNSPYGYTPRTSSGMASGAPGGAIDSIQYNLDNINFGGFGNYNPTSQVVTIPTELNVNNGDPDFTINNINFLTSGSGSSALFDDGTYKPLGQADNIFDTAIGTAVDGVIFTFPPTASPDLELRWETATSQPILLNNSAADTIFYSFRAEWQMPAAFMPAIHWQSDGQIVGLNKIYFTNTILPVVGLDLLPAPANLHLSLRFTSNPNPPAIVNLECDIFSAEVTSNSFIQSHGTYGVV